VLQGKKIAVVMPALNAEKLLAKTIADLDTSIIDDIILVDNASQDHTVEVAQSLGLYVWQHPVNRGFGGNLKQGYRLALQRHADIIATVHPDYQYEPKLVPAMAHLLLTGNYDCVLGCRMTCNGARRGNMPAIRFYGNKILATYMNALTWAGITEYLTGYRCYTRQVLETLPLAENSNDFVFDIQIILQALAFGYRFGEVSCPTRYLQDASSINHLRSLKTSVELAYHTLLYRVHKMGVWRHYRLFGHTGQKLLDITEVQMVGHAVEHAGSSRT
jgi:glycosyltransferase involved in cell wall biosynthesis